MKKIDRICIIAKYSYPHDTRLNQQVRALKENGYIIDIFCLKQSSQASFEETAGIRVFRLMQKKEKEGFFEYVRSTFLFMFLSAFRLIKLYPSTRHRLIVVHTLPEFLVLCAGFNKLTGARIILDARDLSAELVVSRWKRTGVSILRFFALFVEKVSIGFSDHVVIASNGFKRALVSRGYDENKITVMFNTADTKIFNYDSERKFQVLTDRIQLIYHGTVAERFGTIILIEALTILRKAIPRAELTIFGYYDPLYKKRMETFMNDNNLGGAVFLEPSNTLEHINKCIRKMDIGVVPYLSDSFMNKALSTKTFEYVAAGLPVVASRLDPSVELFGDECIQYAIPGDAEDLSQKILDMALNPELRKEKRANAYAKFNQYTDDVMNERYLSVVRKLVPSLRK